MAPRRPLTAALLLLASLVGCSQSTTDDNTAPPDPQVTKPRIDIDPEAYFTDYTETQVEAMAVPSAGGATSVETDSMPQPLPPTIDEANTFVDAGEHPAVSPVDEPTSTFGLEVDTGSLTVGRTFLTAGQRPPVASVRTEEWINALGSSQKAPPDGDLAVAVDGAAAPFAPDGTVLVRVGVAARELSEAERPAAHLTFVVDTSGSMDIRSRLGLVKASLGLLVLNLRDDDTISIVTYSDDAGVLLEPTPVADAERIVEAIDSLEPGGSTNLEGGLRQGYEQADAAFDPDGINAVILASDGVANVGLTDPDGLAGEIQSRASEGIHLVTIGYGMGNFNDDLMEQVADRGDGFYHYLDTFEQAEALFGSHLTSTLVVVAADAKAQVSFDPEMVESYRLIGYENRALDAHDFADDSVDAGEIGAGHRVTALYEVTLSDLATAATAEARLGSVSVRARPADGAEAVTVEAPIAYGAITGRFDTAPADLRLQAVAGTFAQWLGDGATVTARGVTPAELLPVAEAAAAELGGSEPLPGGVVTPDGLVDLIRLGSTASEPIEPIVVD